MPLCLGSIIFYLRQLFHILQGYWCVSCNLLNTMVRLHFLTVGDFYTRQNSGCACVFQQIVLKTLIKCFSFRFFVNNDV